MSGDGPFYTTAPGAGWHQFYDSYSTLEQRIEQQAERIAQLERALVEERARVMLYEADGTIRDWGDVSESEQELYLHHARGVLKNLAS